MATTEQLMAQYGVAWFGFDETSGNVYDKLGNGYVGTVTGATRVEGWNGEGKAMSFNGSNNYVQFTNKFIPINEKTIKFKVKFPLATSPSTLIFDTCGFAGGNYGIWIANMGGRLGFSMLQGSGKENSFYSQNLNDNKWHNIMIVVDSQVDSLSIMKMYVDEKLENRKKMNFPLLQDSTYNLRLGFDNDGNTGGALSYFNGQIDDLQIYNKALSPSDFEQKRLVIQTTDNKNLVLSPTSTRVKEIPNTEESTLLSQGGVIKEIDSAVDRPSIDFTKSTTEYEIVTNNRTSLGKGRMFTIPIGSDFKTAMIEDNY
ncbi:LamG domain-containing protein [Lysinibacillus parviboronicapiens]|uniref:LamG domain-containing protein n=1 Tax=Lysinibacillus parviboronicapiens TaxID=436516 RepID=UPI000D39200F|nr:LamG domain-containing protein [Lysinibacillus parviboronicapiens]